MNNSKTYIAITIGPIVRTLMLAQKTRELWAASYVFSWVMKRIADELRRDESIVFIMPYRDPGDQEGIYLDFLGRRESLEGAGLFPDRIIIESAKDNEIKKVFSIVEGVFEELAGDVAHVLLGSKNLAPSQYLQEEQKIAEYLKEYFNIHLIEKQLPAGENPILQLSPILDVLEQRQQFPTSGLDLLPKYLSQASLSHKTSILAKDAYGSRKTLGKQTIEHLAVAEFFSKDSDQIEYEDAQEEDLKSGQLIDKYNPKPRFLPAHKYVAIVQADGDSVGKTIAKLSPNQFQDFSKVLTAFSIEAVKKIATYGGLPVYAGGDDLLFFAPVLNRSNGLEETDIFSLLQFLDKDFQAKVKGLGITFDEQTPQPTLSFGMSISYYKFPLYESLATAQHLLFDVAKDTDLHPHKHSIVWEVRKHSGATFRSHLSLQSGSSVDGIFNELLGKLHKQDNERVLASVAYKLRNERELVDLIGKNEQRLASYIDNSFNEAIHRQGAPKEFLLKIKQLVPSIYQQFSPLEDSAEPMENKNPLTSESPKDPHVQLFGLLKTLQFLTSQSNA